MIKTNAMGLIVALTLCASAALADDINGINIDFVTIGDAGNAADTDTDPNRSGYGDVGYTYRISTHEITYAQFSASGLGGGNENHWVFPLGSPDAPVANVNWAEAAQYCNWLTSGNINDGAYTVSGNSVTGIDRDAAVGTYGTAYVMPTEDEWYKAAYYTGSGYSLYANGTSTAPAMNVDARYGTSTPWIVGSGLLEQNGTYDMMGNIYEHTETLDGGAVVYRGGGYFQGESMLRATWRITDSATANYITVGLRPVAYSIPEPATISLMGLNTIGLFLTRSIRRRKRLGQSLLPIRRQQILRDEFCAEHELAASGREDQWNDYFSVLIDLVKPWYRSVAMVVHTAYKKVDIVFWNRMVAIHERKVVRRAAFRKAVRKKLLDGFDASLERIMK